MEIYVVMKEVDLGGHPQVSYYDKKLAEKDAHSRNLQYNDQIRRTMELFYVETIDLI